MLQFDLFRIRIVHSAQTPLFAETPSVMLREAIAEKPSSEFRQHTWHVGNVVRLDDNAQYLALGRTGNAREGFFDNESRNFVEVESQVSPFTHVVVDTNLEICGIAKRSILRVKTDTLSQYLAELLNHTTSVLLRRAVVRISPIPDPEDFIQTLYKSNAILNFWIAFSRPNPQDADEYYIKPWQNLLQETDGDKGTARISGNGLNPAPLEELARSSAATGNGAGARVILREGEKPVPRRLGSNPAQVQVDEEEGGPVEFKDLLRNVLSKIRTYYQRIRHSPAESE